MARIVLSCHFAFQALEGSNIAGYHYKSGGLPSILVNSVEKWYFFCVTITALKFYDFHEFRGVHDDFFFIFSKCTMNIET